MIHIRARNTHDAIQQLCRALSSADIIEVPEELPRVREPVGITLHSPHERMVFDKEENPIQWFAALRDMLPEFGKLIEPSMMFAPSRFTTNCSQLELEGWSIFMRNDRGFLDMMVHAGPLHIQNFGEHIFILTMLQEYTALTLRLPMGIFDVTFAQVTVAKDMEYFNRFANAPMIENPYQVSACITSKMDVTGNMLAEVGIYPAMGIRNRWVRRTLSPMWQAFDALNTEEDHDPVRAMDMVLKCEAGDVARAARMYLECQ